MSHYGAHNRAWMAWRMEERKKKVRRFFYHLAEDAGFVMLMMAGVVAMACAIYTVAHR
jgi:hypothetical protein